MPDEVPTTEVTDAKVGRDTNFAQGMAQKFMRYMPSDKIAELKADEKDSPMLKQVLLKTKPEETKMDQAA